MTLPMTRRQFLRDSTAGSLSLAALAHAQAAAQATAVSSNPPRAGDYCLYFGDLHNHSAVGYAQGSLERAFEIARNHLDFFAFTPHGYWHDIGRYEKGIEKKWLDGFEVTKQRWPEVLEMVRRYDRPGQFVAMAGYEWHSRSLGDYHILFPTTEAEYLRFDDLRQFQQFAKERGAIMIPHHPANRLGHRGANLEWLDPAVSPVLEMYSEWGNAEHDRAPYAYVRHTECGRWTKNTLHHFLAQGHRLGVIASTDDHLGYPGGYREGLAAVMVKELTREAIFDALRHRRVYAVTGDRIRLDFQVNGRIMGTEMPYAKQRELAVTVTGWDQLDRVEILKNNRVIHRDFPMDRVPTQRSWEEPVLLRFEYGWGPWAALDMTRICDWDIDIRLENGRLEDVQTCFQAGPLDETRRDKIVARSTQHLRIQSFTALRQQFEDIPTKGVVLKIRGTPETRVEVSLRSPTTVSLSQTFRQLADSGETLFTGDFPKESALLHRLVFHDHYHTSYRVSDVDDGRQVSWYYLRAVQANNQLAWSSPIWVEPAAGAARSEFRL
ncbi:MAG: DUF3604 domain-containing protein [Planctomycetes bacterium]|nr:DUF3604 domain-containing protein [Planctomycetota bacterium]